MRVVQVAVRLTAGAEEHIGELKLCPRLRRQQHALVAYNLETLTPVHQVACIGAKLEKFVNASVRQAVHLRDFDHLHLEPLAQLFKRNVDDA